MLSVALLLVCTASCTFSQPFPYYEYAPVYTQPAVNTFSPVPLKCNVGEGAAHDCGYGTQNQNWFGPYFLAKENPYGFLSTMPYGINAHTMWKAVNSYGISRLWIGCSAVLLWSPVWWLAGHHLWPWGLLHFCRPHQSYVFPPAHVSSVLSINFLFKLVVALVTEFTYFTSAARDSQKIYKNILWATFIGRMEIFNDATRE